jgi:glycosyltransferase involved in cell wall biosynthesis
MQFLQKLRQLSIFYSKTLVLIRKLAYPGLSMGFQGHPRAESKKPTVIYVGRMIKSKGVEFLFDIAKENKAINFVFAGPGELVQSL